MYLTEQSRHAATAERMRLLLRRRGYGPNGKLWTEEEDEICRKLYPDYGLLAKALPNRTRSASKRRCSDLGIARSYRCYTGREQTELRKAYQNDSLEVLRAKFPHRTESALRRKAKSLGLSRPRCPYVTTGNYLLDDLRRRTFRTGLNMADLDEFTRSRGYFRERLWRGPRGRIQYQHIVNAIHELGGRLSIDWGDDR